MSQCSRVAKKSKKREIRPVQRPFPAVIREAEQKKVTALEETYDKNFAHVQDVVKRWPYASRCFCFSPVAEIILHGTAQSLDAFALNGASDVMLYSGKMILCAQ